MQNFKELCHIEFHFLLRIYAERFNIHKINTCKQITKNQI